MPIALKAVKIRLKHRMGAVDCMMYATARLKNLKLLTGDKHFEGFEDVIMI